ncbi:MAG: hypothetical protein J0I79_33800, partial [Mesorhizobium sp.]|nr:hypothetical protein [Mesorhizobium sp.]
MAHETGEWMMRKFRPTALGAVGWLAVCGPALAQTQPAPDMPAISTFGRWTTMVDALDTGQDAHKTCAASTAFFDASGNSGTLTLSISTGDALPPNAYPAIMITIDNRTLVTAKKVAAVFGDPGVKVPVTVFSGDAVNGRPTWTVDNQPKSSLALLLAMRQVTSLDV